MKNPILIIIVLACCTACHTDTPEISFYHWKSKMTANSATIDLLDQNNTTELYVHYFDIKSEKNPGNIPEQPYPTYVLTDVDSVYANYTIIPVIFIVNDVLKHADIKQLADHTSKLIHQISTHHFRRQPTEIQLDCDWTQTTRDAFFDLIALLKQDFQITCTIRLHQIKYYRKTGVPPVDNGVLMLYNMGDLKEMNENSILSLKVVKAYINANTAYPLPLDVALPAFSQTVILFPDRRLKLINTGSDDQLAADTAFKYVADHVFETRYDKLYKGFFLSKGSRLKTENPRPEEIIRSYHFLKNSDLDLSSKILFYHLDGSAENTRLMNEIIHGL